EGEAVTFQTFDDGPQKRSGLACILHGDLTDCADRLVGLNLSGAGVFWTVNFTDGAGRKAENVTEVRALFVDLDGAPLQPVMDAGVDPHAVVESSPGRWHVYWLVEGCQRDRFGQLQRALAMMFGADPSVHDLPRVLRVPGFVHRKGEPFRTRIVSLEPMQPYAVAELVQRLGLSLSAPPPAAPRVDPATGEITGKVTHPGRHEHLRRKLADMNWRGIPEAGIRAALHQINMQDCDPPKLAAEVDALVSDWIQRYANQHGQDQRQQQASAPSAPQAPQRPPFELVPVDDLDTAHIPPQRWVWEDYIPAGQVTLLGAHGGAGKSTLSLMLAASVALGLPLFGVDTDASPVVFYSAEDGSDTVRRRLRGILSSMGVPAASLADRLLVLDASDTAPELAASTWCDDGQGGRRPTFGLTKAGADLRDMLAPLPAPLLIVDNASDAFGGNENARPEVRAFVRLLAGMVRKQGGAVMLLSHLDKNAARGLSSESYSGSTAWHNSARSRLFIERDKDGAGLALKHEKANFGRLREPPGVAGWRAAAG
ncbi:MAG TPA: AAA family ATPase, partial [Rubrivivax sp.]|nr:AAA family ATPase [Rubrivivax sp.]